jgi:YD repeat-containing protein
LASEDGLIKTIDPDGFAYRVTASQPERLTGHTDPTTRAAIAQQEFVATFALVGCLLEPDGYSTRLS